MQILYGHVKLFHFDIYEETFQINFTFQPHKRLAYLKVKIFEIIPFEIFHKMKLELQEIVLKCKLCRTE